MRTAEEFMANVVKSDGCWEWSRAKASNGYGKLSWCGRVTDAHRVSYALFVGEIPHGLFVMHKCDNRLCVRPDHLMTGTHAENMRDMTSKGRARNNPSRGDQHWSKIHPELFAASRVGEANGNAKLTRADVEKIRAAYGEGVHVSVLAKEFGVNWKTAKRAATGEGWKVVAAPSAVFPLYEGVRGSRNAFARLREDQVAQIKGRIGRGELLRAIAKDFGVHHATISAINVGKTWGHVAAVFAD